MMQRSLLILPLSSCLFLSVLGCGRHKLRSDEIERNRIFAAILQCEDHRALGNDDFLSTQLETSPDSEVRKWCAVALGRIGNPRTLPRLYQSFDSPYAAVRAAAAFAVGEIEDREMLREQHRSVDPWAAVELAKLLDDPSLQVQMRAIEALGKVGSHNDAGKIAGRLKNFSCDGTPLERAYLDFAITALMRLRNPAAYPILERLAETGDPATQWRALNALVRMNDKNARPIFLRQLNSAHPDVRAYAARGIGVCEDPSLAELLSPWLLPRDPSTGHVQPLSVRVCAVQSLGRLRNPRSIAAIKDALAATPIVESDRDQMNFAIQAATALGDIGAPEGEWALLPLLNKGGPVADSAIVGIAKLLNSEPNRFFQLAHEDHFTTPAGRRAWAQALGELGGSRAILELKRMLIRSTEANATPSDTLAVPAILAALKKAKAPDLAEILKPYLASHDGVILRAAVEAYKPDSTVRSPWAPLLQAYAGIGPGNDAETKVAVLNSLKDWVIQSEVQTALRTALQDRVRNARITAARLLRQAGAPDIPDDPGPCASNIARATYEMLAGARKDRTVAILEVTRGLIEIELFREDAPLTVDNFISLAKQGFFDGLSFMRVVPYFVVQSGDPRNDMEGGPGYSIRCEINMRPFEHGSVGMALSGKDTGGSQFFITLSPQPHLDGGYTCFGRVVAGMPVADGLLPGDRILKVRIEEDITALDYRKF